MTKRQKDCLDFIKRYWTENAISPSYDDIRSGLGLRSKSSVHRLVESLVAHGELLKQVGRRSLYLPPEPGMNARAAMVTALCLIRSGQVERAEQVLSQEVAA